MLYYNTNQLVFSGITGEYRNKKRIFSLHLLQLKKFIFEKNIRIFIFYFFM